MEEISASPEATKIERVVEVSNVQKMGNKNLVPVHAAKESIGESTIAVDEST